MKKTLEERLNILEDRVNFICDYLNDHGHMFPASLQDYEDEIEFKDFAPKEEEEPVRYVNKMVYDENGVLQFVRERVDG